MFDTVMVSTDDEEIAEVAKSYGAEVPFLRNDTTASDYATTLDVLKEVHRAYEFEDSYFAQACCIYATAPFANGALLRRTYEKFIQGEFASLFPVVRYGHPIQRALHLSDDAKVTMIGPEYIDSRSQDLTPSYHDCGMFYWYQVQRILQGDKLWTENSGGYEVAESGSHDIDSLEDWKMAEMKYQLLYG